ncbi:P4Hc domain containing protein [Pyrenophora tritici-repentis]|uniref:P4Hc domain containing protein n=1 Tax=Pyrenophora tritici-repentis TaxID=45151 RepID=A0A317AID4_9PLEO|nr:P4Hc domain containing protein [Pyrenophora tritici-repentis]
MSEVPKLSISNIWDGATNNIAQTISSLLTNAAYACGGTVKPSLPAAPVTIRWDAPHSIEKLTFPSPSDDPVVQKLVETTQPAGFGFQGKDIMDETYRKASKLDTSEFSINFCPYEVGIIDVIGQALLPRLPNSSQGILAKLYKLNVYQAPSGLFKPHIDTPRSGLQFGSLVVCLPCPHEGGQLVVRHQGQVTVFDWSGPARDVQWAAFYSDCEHEVLEVTSGYRITLTYNLYARCGLGEIAGHADALDVQQLPLYKEVKDALAQPEFMSEGESHLSGYLGKYCSHAYAHATTEGASALPAVLKGSDMIAFEVFRSLGVEVLVRPVLEHISNIDYGNPLDEILRTHHHVGKELGKPLKTEAVWGYGNNLLRQVYAEYPNTLIKVKWVNEPMNAIKSVQFGFALYGNEPSTEFVYSFCALLFKIMPYSERVELAMTKEGREAERKSIDAGQIQPD